MSHTVTDDLNKLRKGASAVDNGSAIEAKKKEAYQADLAALERNAKEIGDTLTGYEKAYKQLLDQYAFLKEFATPNQEIELKRRLNDTLEKWLEGKAIELNESLKNAKKEVQSTTEEVQKKGTDYEGKKTAANLPQKDFDYWKSSPKPYEDMLKEWQGLRETIKKYSDSKDQLPAAYLYTLLLKKRLRAPFPAHVLKEILQDAWRKLYAAKEESRDSRIEFDKKAVELETAKKTLEQLQKQGVEDILRDLPTVPPPPSPPTTAD